MMKCPYWTSPLVRNCRHWIAYPECKGEAKTVGNGLDRSGKSSPEGLPDRFEKRI